MASGARRWVRRLGLALGAAVGIGAVGATVGVALAWEAMGAAPEGTRAERMAASPRFDDGAFTNPQPMWNDYRGWITEADSMSPVAEPLEPVPTATDTAARLATPPGPLRVTWLGHASTLIELGGRRILTDPFFGDSPFPLPSLGPQRWYPPPLPLDAVRDVDVVLISHDHYDHLDHPTIVRLAEGPATFVAPLGVGAHLEYWGVAPERVVELDWWDAHAIDGVRIVATPARHASGRHLLDQNRTLWAGYALLSDARRVYYSGDTGLFDDLTTIGERYGPFDLVMIEVGAYHRTWPDWHMGPEQALEGHRRVRGELFLPVHWGLFNLALHGWTEPVERTWAAAERAGIRFVTPMPGEVVDVDHPPPPRRWWPDRPWQTAAEAPVTATRRGDSADRYPVPDFAR